jgi:hypothetical protein
MHVQRALRIRDHSGEFFLAHCTRGWSESEKQSNAQEIENQSFQTQHFLSFFHAVCSNRIIDRSARL